MVGERIVIVGAGHASGQAVATLKQKKFGGEIVLLGEEAYLPYQRPPLSKKFLAGEMPAERLYIKPETFYADDNIDVRLGTRADSIDRDSKQIATASGDTVPYDKLIVATGSRVREVPVAGIDLDGTHYLRSIADVDAIRSGLQKSKRLVIVGAGYIGLEVAAVTRTLGQDVTVLEMANRVMSRVVSQDVSAFYEGEHRTHGVKLKLGSGLESIQGDTSVTGVATTDGQVIPADMVVIGVGIVPNTELAAKAGLDVDNGIVVDDRCRSSDPDIYAIGDCTSHPNSIYGRTVRLESVHNALEQAKTTASNLVGDDVIYSQVPWFWSDQYDLKLQIAGLSEGYDEVIIRGSPEERSFSCLYLRSGRLIALDAINAPRDFVQSKALIASGAAPDPAKLRNSEIALKELA